jgi:glycosyltransferase involved in cell wall biosynthesis
MPACSIVIRAFNEAQHIRRLLDGVAQQTIQEIEIILVDSGSTDSTVAIAAQYPVQILHIPPQDFTFGRSINLGISHSHSELVVFASAHVYPVYPDWLEHLLAPFSDPQVALTYGKQRGNQATKFSEQQVFARWYPNNPDWKQKHPFCNNANAAIRRSLWQQRPYDESLTGLEDLDWANWAVDQGFVLAYNPDAEVIHVHNEKPGDVYNRYRREAMAFKRIFPHEHFNIWNFIRLTSTNIASDLWHAARQGVLLPNLASIFWFRWMQFGGTYRGYRQSGPLTWQLRKTFYYPHGAQDDIPLPARKVEPIRYNDPPERL